MKKLILVLVLFVYTTVGFSQDSWKDIDYETYIISFTFDAKLGFDEAYPDNGNPNTTHDGVPVSDIRLTVITRTKERNEIGVYIELAQLTPRYFSFGGLYNRNIPVIPEWKGMQFETLLGGTAGLIHRQFEGNEKLEISDYDMQKLFLTASANATLRILFFDGTFGLETGYQLTFRNDLRKNDIQNQREVKKLHEYLKSNVHIGLTYQFDRKLRKLRKRR